MIAFGDMMRKQIVMPAHLMDDREHSNKNGRNLFKDFSSVAQATGTYTGKVGAPLFPCVMPLSPASSPTPRTRCALGMTLQACRAAHERPCSEHLFGHCPPPHYHATTWA